MGEFALDRDVEAALDADVWVFVGLGDDPSREVWRQARLMASRGKTVYGVHPTAQKAGDIRVFGSLDDVPKIGVVGVYRRAEAAGEIVDDAVRVGADAVWMPLGVVDEAAAGRARDAGVSVVMDRCPAVEWGRRR